MLEKILSFWRKIIPIKLFRVAQPVYHYLLAFFAALWYRFPSKKIFVLAVTGTKGKTTTIELLNAILEEAGYRTALSSTLRFKIGGTEERNLRKMTSPGRFFIQRFLRGAVKEKCDYAIVETTSEGARQFRHRFIDFDALLFTNLSPEHIESHGSYEAYRDAKLSIARAVAISSKRKKIIIANKDDEEGGRFLSVRGITESIPYSIADVKPYTLKKEGVVFVFKGENITTKLSGEFNLYNLLAAATFADSQNIGIPIIKRALERFIGVPGRMQKIEAGQDFTVIVDYAHTPDSLEKVYETYGLSRKICVLGAAGGGRDSWKRPVLGQIANAHCSEIILTDEDPYDDAPEAIIDEIANGISRPIVKKIANRREAIRHAISLAKTGDTVIITGKGTDPFIMRANGVKEPWNDAAIVEEELTSRIKHATL
ncbi:MAG: UDP-N-acetylmuramyl-tripeptide synthetase [Parcubacteria group bacterium]|nr:UDP-N-acetylmuramyl-tripeptide synthetase [Parcubacteria group bacterium]